MTDPWRAIYSVLFLEEFTFSRQLHMREERTGPYFSRFAAAAPAKTVKYWLTGNLRTDKCRC